MIQRYFKKHTDRLIAKIYDEDHGGELVETALLIGFLVVAALGIMAKLGYKVMNIWIQIRDTV